MSKSDKEENIYEVKLRENKEKINKIKIESQKIFEEVSFFEKFMKKVFPSLS